ncbi:MAG: MBL fold metallo-hydrolase [Hyphomonadaceae bacterium]|nr:MBL fold metallo-hydrolase [Hyphomonadaceae bacterium]
MDTIVSRIAASALALGCWLLLAGSAFAEAAQPARWITLGTSGGPNVQAERAQIANALVVGADIYLFDVGDGVRRQLALAGLRDAQVKAVFVSHHHVDHNAGLGPLIVAHGLFGAGALVVAGPEGTGTLVDGLVAANAPTMLASFPTSGPARPPLSQATRTIEIAPTETPRIVYEDGAVRVSAISVPHFQQPPSIPLPRMPQAVAYRVEAGGRLFVYSGDTGPTDKLIAFARGADVLISEIVAPEAIATALARDMAAAPSALREAIVRGMTRNHLTPAEVGRIATAARVRQVVLTHFVPTPEDSPAGAFERDLRAHYRGDVKLARDLDAY